MQVTLLALREVRKYMFIGIYESEARELIRAALSAAGLEGGDGLVLFGGECMLYPQTVFNAHVEKRMPHSRMEVGRIDN